ncbi:MAG: class I SAM-dependent methyltransferase [Candidatus Thorarchaeota archaeon]
MSTTTNRPHTSNTSYRVMAWYLRLRERFRKPADFVSNLGIEEGHNVLDYGCGIGSYTVPTARLVGESGRVYALDIHPLAIERVKKRAKKEGLSNIETIQSDLATGLPDNHLDFALLIDVYTWIEDKIGLLKEMHRTLQPSGKLVFLIDHASPEGCKTTVEESGLFRLILQEANVLQYEKV